MSPNNFVFVPLVKDEIKPEDLREPRYKWSCQYKIKITGDIEKVLHDRKTGAVSHYSPSINEVRDLGPDFDYNPMNFPSEFAKYNPVNTFPDYATPNDFYIRILTFD